MGRRTSSFRHEASHRTRYGTFSISSLTLCGGLGGPQCAAADSYSFAVSSKGEMFSWGNGARGRLGHADLEGLAKDANGEVYLSLPRKVEALADVHVEQASPRLPPPPRRRRRKWGRGQQ